MIWTVGSVPFFGKRGSSVLAKCSLYGIETSFCFRQAQYVQVFPLKSVAFCNLSADLASTNKSAISLFFSSSQTFALFTTSWFLLLYSLLSLLPQTLWQIWQEFSSLSSLYYQTTVDSRASFLPGNDTDVELAKRGDLLVPSATPCSLSSLISALAFSRAGGVLSHLIFLTNRFPLRNWCSLVTLAMCSLAYAATDTALCQTLTSLES